MFFTQCEHSYKNGGGGCYFKEKSFWNLFYKTMTPNFSLFPGISSDQPCSSLSLIDSPLSRKPINTFQSVEKKRFIFILSLMFKFMVFQWLPGTLWRNWILFFSSGLGDITESRLFSSGLGDGTESCLFSSGLEDGTESCLFSSGLEDGTKSCLFSSGPGDGTESCLIPLDSSDWKHKPLFYTQNRNNQSFPNYPIIL